MSEVDMKKIDLEDSRRDRLPPLTCKCIGRKR